jgi:NAD(P)-dependent dehydrogenase (short-subunit alcohol dehydrogenase family)
MSNIRDLYDFSGRTVVLTGGTGVLGSEMSRALAGCNANVVLVGRSLERAQRLIESFPKTAARHIALQADVLDRAALDEAVQKVVDAHGRVDGLVNAAGGNDPKATTNAQQRFFDIPAEAFQHVVSLNLLGTVIPTQAFARRMAEQREGIVVNITSVSADRPLTRVAAYGTAKAAISNFTQWLAVHLAQEYSPQLRVNAIMPGFFLTEQNRFLLTDRESGALTDRGKKIMDHTPLGRFGAPDDLTGTLLWLLSPASKFVTGIVVPVDGGFTAYSGV